MSKLQAGKTEVSGCGPETFEQVARRKMSRTVGVFKF